MRNRSPRAGWLFQHVIGLIVVLALVLPVSVPLVEAAPGTTDHTITTGRQLPDWLSPETAVRLAVGIDVLIPEYVPAPFGGEPEVQASDGFYSLYWLIPGAPPTYLRITGTAGGEIPAFSYYDRNNQLVQNDSVMGYPAWHDVTPIYDLVYWQVGNVVYTVESHNMTGDTTMGVANSLMSLVVPDSSGQMTEPDPEATESPDESAQDDVAVSMIGAPTTMASGGIASIGLEGRGDVYLVASAGYFLVTGESGIWMTAGTAVDWQAPVTDEDLDVTFGAYRLSDDKKLAETTTTVFGVAAPNSNDTPIDLQCPANASTSTEARFALIGSGGVTLSSSSGYWPIEMPNTDFQPNMDGGPTIQGGLGQGATVSLIWMAPDETGSATISVADSTGNEVDSCTVNVVSQRGAGDLGAPPPTSDGQAAGDGTGISEADKDIVPRIMANPIGFAGDASGGPEANGPDYGYVEPVKKEEPKTATTSRTPVSSSAQSLSEFPDSKLGPAAGADGMYAVTLDTSGGKLESPYGATVIVPEGCLKDQTTVTIKPVDDKAVPETAGISTIAGTAFDVGFGAADGRAVNDLEIPAVLTIALQSASMTESARIYRVEGNTLKLMPLTASDAGSISTEIDGLARYVVGVPQGNTAASTTSINPFLIGGLGLIALISAGLLISRGLSKRKPRLIPARRPANGRVRYR
jgi:hypothetical protein